jgi:magnesium transporter
MIDYYVFSKGKLISESRDLGFLRVALYEEDIQVWVDADQPTPEETKALLEDVFSFHPLAIEDCTQVSERPKIEQYENYIFMVIHAIDFLQSQHEFGTTELNLFIGKNFLVTYHRDPLRSITGTKERVLKNAAAIAKAPDRLTYHVLDLLLDNYEPALADVASDIAELERDVLTATSMDIMTDIVNLKTQIQKLRLIMGPQREVIARLARGEFPIVRTSMLPYYRDLLDRLMRFTDMAENHRESLSNTIQLLLNLQQNRTNQVVKVLTILATLSTPTLLITSFYGMNFKTMPELDWNLAHIWWVFGLAIMLTGIIYAVLHKKKYL